MASIEKNWTILEILNWTTQHLQLKGFENPRLNVELLLAHILKCRRIDLYLQFEMVLRPAELMPFKELYQRRLNHEPIQYIIGEVDFYGLKFKITPEVLIPRPETELLVETALKFIQSFDNPSVLDVGTGSGVIAICLAVKSQAKVTAIDSSEQALRVARDNAKNHAVEEKVKLQKMDILEESQKIEGKPFDMIVSNPPYIPEHELSQLPPEIKNFEPIGALAGGPDGLMFYHRLASLGQINLNPGGWLLVEVNDKTGIAVKSIFEQNGYHSVECKKDYSKLDRIVYGKK